jgi:RNA polymerase sigma-70 factor, ECF subfamily
MTELQEKFCNLIRENRVGLFRIAMGILRNNNDAEDAVSETTCKAFANFHKLRNFESFKPWIIKILVNEAYAITKKRKSFEALIDIAAEGIDTAALDSHELWDAVQLLNAEFRNVTIVFYYEDMSIKDISRILNLPQGTVNSRLNRSREKLRSTLVSNGGYINE